MYKRDPNLKITITGEGFALTGRRGLREEYRWKEIKRVVAYKEDMFTMDRICFAIDFLGDRPSIILDEQMADFVQLDQAFAAHLPSYDGRWRGVVVQPPFAPNPHTVFSRPTEESSSGQP